MKPSALPWCSHPRRSSRTGWPRRPVLYVVVEELIPETVRSGTIDVATLGFIVGFAVMMALDNALG